jgi:DNA helicase-2/ATP-dependent DNA helicase PcrA
VGKIATAEAPVVPVAPRHRLIGTPQQEQFWSELVEGSSHVVLEARAGTGKSTSCREGIWRLLETDPGLRPSYVAFNRAIADEFQAKLPPGATATTMHSAGYAALRASLPGVGDPAKFKMWDIVDTFLPRKDRTTRQAKAATVRLAELCKGYLLDGTEPGALDRLAASHGVNVPWALRTMVLGLVPVVLARCLEQASVVCFSDMVWLPVKLGLEFPPSDILFVDESQDLDPCQHALVQRIAGAGRLVTVGDPYQAIYGFRGADARSIATLAGQLARTSRGRVLLPLTMTRRCPRSHVALAARLVPDFEALPDAPGGRIDVNQEPESVLEPGVMALCRTNAPLVGTAYRLIGLGVPVAIQGRDLGDGLAKLVEGFGATTTAELMDQVERYRARETTRLSALENSEGDIEALNDQCACVIAASAGLLTVADVVIRIRSLFLDVSPANQGRYVLLSSIHRAKGREAAHVVILRPDLLPHKMARTAEQLGQERNLAYVAVTRSTHRLSFCGPIPDLFHQGA